MLDDSQSDAQRFPRDLAVSLTWPEARCLSLQCKVAELSRRATDTNDFRYLESNFTEKGIQ